eukprot:2615872-Rhodomonas_salina.1
MLQSAPALDMLCNPRGLRADSVLAQVEEREPPAAPQRACQLPDAPRPELVLPGEMMQDQRKSASGFTIRICVQDELGFHNQDKVSDCGSVNAELEMRARPEVHVPQLPTALENLCEPRRPAVSYVVPAQVQVSQPGVFPDQFRHHLAPALVDPAVAQIEVRELRAVDQRVCEGGRALVAQHVLAQRQMPQPGTPAQLARHLPDPAGADLIGAEVEVLEVGADSENCCESVGRVVPDDVVREVEVSERAAVREGGGDSGDALGVDAARDKLDAPQPRAAALMRETRAMSVARDL